MKRIELTGKKGKGAYAIVDDDDYEFLSRLKWHMNNGYACHNVYDSGEGQELFYMHTIALGARREFIVDHINRNKLDNRKCNLRHIRRGKNYLNSGLSKNNTTGFRGIRRYRNRWVAIIKVDRRAIYLGTYTTAEAAALEYDKAVKQYYGDHVYLNFPQLQ